MKEEEQIKLRLEALNWEKENRNIGNRAVHEHHGGCQYENEYGYCCAVGRLMTATTRKHIAESNLNGSGIRLVWEELRSLDPYQYPRGDEIKAEIDKLINTYGYRFLTSLQALHDEITYWDENGLTAEGIDEYNVICRAIYSMDWTC